MCVCACKIQLQDAPMQTLTMAVATEVTVKSSCSGADLSDQILLIHFLLSF